MVGVELAMINLLDETRVALRYESLMPEDVNWIGSSNGKYAITWEDFEKIADFKYDNGYGGQEIASDLVIVGHDWWFSRHEYDGSEGWEFHSRPIITSDAKTFTILKDPNSSWTTIEEMNRSGGKYGPLWE